MSIREKLKNSQPETSNNNNDDDDYNFFTMKQQFLKTRRLDRDRKNVPFGKLGPGLYIYFAVLC